MKINDKLTKDIRNRISNITGKILWTNPKPTSEFETQNITLNSSDYDFYEVFYCSNTNSTNKTYEIKRGLKGYGITMNVVVNNANTYRTIQYVDNITLNVGSGYSGTEIQERRCVPIYVIGYKTGLF